MLRKYDFYEVSLRGDPNPVEWCSRTGLVRVKKDGSYFYGNEPVKHAKHALAQGDYLLSITEEKNLPAIKEGL